MAPPRLDLELVFKHSGGAELRRSDDTVVWASDSDMDFQDKFGTEIMSGDDDAEPVLEYLVSHGTLTEDEAPEVGIYDESLSDDPDDDEDDEDFEDDDEEEEEED